MNKARRMLTGGWLGDALSIFTRGWFTGQVVSEPGCLEVSDALAYDVALTDSLVYSLNLSDMVVNAVTLADAPAYSVALTDAPVYNLTISDEACLQ